MPGKPKVYIETSVISFLVSKMSRNLITAAYQQITRDWWERHLGNFTPFISDFVIEEISKGDKDTAKLRLEAVNKFKKLEFIEEVQELAEQYRKELLIPRKAFLDIFHIAISVIHGMDYIISWNFRHIANAIVRHKIRKINSRLGIPTPDICTPEELITGE